MGPGREQVQVIPLEAQGPQRLETLESTWKTPMVWDVAKLTSAQVDAKRPGSNHSNEALCMLRPGWQGSICHIKL